MTNRAILFADLVGYARLTRRDETATLDYMAGRFAEARAAADRRGGSLVKTTGDGFVALFPAVAEAIAFAFDFHAASPLEDPRRFRIGLHFGPVREEEGDVYGHAVNVAARLEALAPPGGVLVSQIAFDHAGDVAARFTARGPAVMKNIGERMPVYVATPGPAAGESARTVHVGVIGGIVATTDTGEELETSSRPARNLLGVLGLSDGEGRLRAECAALLGPDGGDSGGVFTRARRALERAFAALDAEDALISDDLSVRLAPALVRVDLDDLLKRARRGDVDDRLVRGVEWESALAPGLETINSTARSWTRVVRERWRRDAGDALETCLDRFRPEEEGARRAATALLAMEPGHEPASRMLIEHFAANGNRAAALKEYERLSGWLDERFGIAPEDATDALVAALRSGSETTAPKAATGGGDAVHRPDLRIAAFTSPSALQDVAVGLRGEVVAALSRFREWTVTEEEGEDPAGDYRLSARVAAGGADFTLTKVANGGVIWRERMTLSAGGWTTADGALVARIAARMEVYISVDRVSRAFAAPTGGDGFDVWMRAEGLLGRWTKTAEAEAATAFEAIIERDPEFAPAYASLASIHNVRHIVRPGASRDAETTTAALRLAERAVELDPLDARSQLALAWAAAMAGRFDQALVHLDLAATLNPTSARTVVSAAMGLAFFGQATRAADLFDRTAEAAPLLAPWQWCYAGTIRYLAKDLDGALEATARGGDAIADNQGWRAAALAEMERDAEARAAFEDFAEEIIPVWEGTTPPSPRSLATWFVHAYPLRRPKDRARLAAAIARAADVDPAEITGSA